jgi:hypothetical protein
MEVAAFNSAKRACYAGLDSVTLRNEVHPLARLTREELHERTTIHFTPYADNELCIGGRSPRERGVADITAELSD